MIRLARRDFVLSGAAFAGLAALAGCSREDAAKERASDPLAAFIFVLFPHEALDSSVYEEVANRVRASLESHSDWTELQRSGMTALNNASGGDWTTLDYDGQSEATAEIATTAFFRSVYQASLVEFYSHPQVWALVGYPGASARLGGYLHRGFDDIDWLPGEAQ